MFGTVCSQLSQWMEQGGEPLPISVNLSSVDIASEQLIPQILEITRPAAWTTNTWNLN